MISPELVSSMASDVAELWRRVTLAAAEVDSQNYVQLAHERVAQLDAQRVEVFTGRLAYSAWKRDVDEELRVLGSDLAQAAEPWWVWGATQQTAAELGEGAGDIAAAAKSGTVWGAAAAVVVLLVVWRLS